MRFRLTTLPGVLQVEPDPQHDARGLFARLYCPDDFHAAGVAESGRWQVSLSRNPGRHTLRGLHYQAPPHAEAKLVRAVRGRAWDVVLDLRADSPHYLDWIALELDAEAMNAVFVPPGCAHGFLTLQPDTDILYQISPPYEAGHGRGARWNDPAFAIPWPAEPALMDPRDACWPDWIGPRHTVSA
jgi:dTDP-4-dehydrorhamnose 3,5-epimerase